MLTAEQESSPRLRELRQAAWAKYVSLPLPRRTDEEWRRTDPAWIPLSQVEMEPAEEPLQVSWEPPAPEAIQAGVILTDLRTARKNFPDLLERYLFQSGTPAGLGKFVSLHQALSRQGLFLYVPEGVRVTLPLLSRIESSRSKSALFPHLLVAAGAGSEVTLIDERRSTAATADPVVSDEMAELFLGAEARVRYVRIQQWESNVVELFTQRAVLERGAIFLNVFVGLGARLCKANVETLLAGPEARAELLGILIGSGRQHFDVHTLQDHQAERSFSDLLYKSALADQAKAVYTGLIRIAPHAQKSDAYQANRNLLLSAGAKADSLPMLEIEANDVRCTHGVAVGPVDEEQLFYLMSRGLSRPEAERLIVHGFFEPLLGRIPSPQIQERLLSELDQKIDHPGGVE